MPQGETFPKAFVGAWRYVRLALGQDSTTIVNALPTWTIDALLVGVAARPSGCRDVAGLGQWLEVAAHRVGVDTVVSLLNANNAEIRQRTAYLLSAALFRETAEVVSRTYQPSQPVWLGSRIRGGRFDAAAMVNDTLLRYYLSIGAGA